MDPVTFPWTVRRIIKSSTSARKRILIAAADFDQRKDLQRFYKNNNWMKMIIGDALVVAAPLHTQTPWRGWEDSTNRVKGR